VDLHLLVVEQLVLALLVVVLGLELVVHRRDVRLEPLDVARDGPALLHELLHAVVEHEAEVVERHVLAPQAEDRDLLVLERRLALLHVALEVA